MDSLLSTTRPPPAENVAALGGSACASVSCLRPITSPGGLWRDPPPPAHCAPGTSVPLPVSRPAPPECSWPHEVLRGTCPWLAHGPGVGGSRGCGRERRPLRIWGRTAQRDDEGEGPRGAARAGAGGAGERRNEKPPGTTASDCLTTLLAAKQKTGGGLGCRRGLAGAAQRSLRPVETEAAEPGAPAFRLYGAGPVTTSLLEEPGRHAWSAHEESHPQTEAGDSS